MSPVDVGSKSLGYKSNFRGLSSRVQENLMIQKRANQLELYSSSIQSIRMYPWAEPPERSGTIIGHSIAAHHVRMIDLAREIEVPRGFSKKLLVEYSLVDGDCPFLELNKNVLKQRFSELRLGEKPYPYMLDSSPSMEYAIVKCMSIVDLLKMAEQNNSLREFDEERIRTVWLKYRMKVNNGLLKEINGRIGSLPEEFDVNGIICSELADLWGSKLEEWDRSSLPERVAKIMDSFYCSSRSK